MFRNIDVHAASDFVLRWSIRILLVIFTAPLVLSLMFDALQAGLMG